MSKKDKEMLILISLFKFNLSLLGTFHVTRAALALQSHDLSGEGINSGSHTYFLITQGHGGPPRMRVQLNAGTTSETTRT